MNGIALIGLGQLSKVQYVDTLTFTDTCQLDLTQKICNDVSAVIQTHIFRVVPHNLFAGHHIQQVPRVPSSYPHKCVINSYLPDHIFTLPANRSFVYHGQKAESRVAYCHRFYTDNINPRHLLNDKPLVYHFLTLDFQELHHVVLENHTEKTLVVKFVKLFHSDNYDVNQQRVA